MYNKKLLHHDALFLISLIKLISRLRLYFAAKCGDGQRQGSRTSLVKIN